MILDTCRKLLEVYKRLVGARSDSVLASFGVLQDDHRPLFIYPVDSG